MIRARREFLHLTSAVLGGLLATPPRIAAALDYPTRPVRVIVPFAPGGPTDVFARLLAQQLSEQLKTQFYVENLAGAGGNIGTGRAAEATADGYTLLVDGANLVVNPELYKQVPYDPIKDFAPVTIAVVSPVILTVHPSLPVHSVKELVELIKANPAKYSYASPGVGTPPHLVGELFRLTLKLDLVHVPFNGGGPAIGSAVAGHTPISFGAMAPAVPLVKAGSLRALAVSTKTRSQALPDVPTMAEQGYPEIEGETWFTLVAPARTPKDIIALLYRETSKAVAAPVVKERLASLGYEPVGSTPEECDAQFKTEMAKWTRVIRDAGIKGE
ncbi:MAG TPA: tripartite tricarboxylate transporter substrate binding protein [Xanthobacteraceae bacterium]|jgi:tripartite-type tricarboxylate transporter receptor subunit TctC|nr:tripartite tricarboxylate transporter substrate binding protein [Xanthobacteraceae bacterium]